MNFSSLSPFGMSAIGAGEITQIRERTNSEVAFAIEKYDDTFQNLIKNYKDPAVSDTNLIHAAILSLGDLVQRSQEKTMQGLLNELTQTADHIFLEMSEEKYLTMLKSRMTFKAIFEIYKMAIKRQLAFSTNKGDMIKIKKSLANQTERMAQHSLRTKDIISRHSTNLIRTGMRILVHSFSRNVMVALKNAVERGISVSVITTRCLPVGSGKDVKLYCDKYNIPCTIIDDAGVGASMYEIDCVFVGADCVLENGGIVNRIGTFTIALCAKAFNKPFYVFVESLKFFKRFPLQQSDIATFLGDNEDQDALFKAGIDYTPPEYISELLTDIGIFTPAAVSDELIKFFQLR